MKSLSPVALRAEVGTAAVWWGSKTSIYYEKERSPNEMHFGGNTTKENAAVADRLSSL